MWPLKFAKGHELSRLALPSLTTRRWNCTMPSSLFARMKPWRGLHLKSLVVLLIAQSEYFPMSYGTSMASTPSFLRGLVRFQWYLASSQGIQQPRKIQVQEKSQYFPLLWCPGFSFSTIIFKPTVRFLGPIHMEVFQTGSRAFVKKSSEILWHPEV